TQLKLQLAHFGKEGTVAFDDVRITPVDAPAATPAAAASAALDLRWGDEPVVDLSPTRSEVVLNGIWKFMPAVGPAADAPAGQGWGYIRVPGGWASSAWWAEVPGLVQAGSGAMWDADLGQLGRAWYERPLTVPAEWAGRRVLLDFQRISTDANVFLDGKAAGSINWPGGEVDITDAVTPGRPQTLRVEVLASTDRETVIRFMETATAQISVEKAQLSVRGIAGDVVLASRPEGAHVSDVFVQPSVRRKQLVADVEIAGVTAAGKATITAEAINGAGDVEKTFTKTVALDAAEKQVVQLAGPWENPALWDLDRPNLYTLRVSVQGAGVDDVYPQSFGFREFWVDGKDFYLNGTKIHLRPYNNGGGYGMAAVEGRIIDAARAAGFNFCELWPNDDLQRGRVHWREAFVDVADRKGMLVGGSMGYMNDHIVRRWRGEVAWNEPGGRDQFEAELAADIRRWRNHPSIVVWASSGNFFGHDRDQHPRVIGTEGWVPEDEKDWHARAEAGRDGIALIKEYDPTRPVFTHHGAYVGDVHTVNMYLAMIPLQEREEWLSEYARTGTMPFMAVEFGGPVNLTLRRSRINHAYADTSEPWATEFAATYLGDEAYRLEDSEYRDGIAEFYIGEDPENPWKSRWPEPQRNPAVQKLLDLYITNTLRSWRTWGIPGGMIFWIDAHGWQVRPEGYQDVALPPFEPGTRGPYFDKLQKQKVFHYSPEAYDLTPAGEALTSNNNSTLAWIAGPAENLALKDHSFRSGETLNKQAALLNDTRTSVAYSGKVTVELGEKTIAEQNFAGDLAPGERLMIPIRVDLPTADSKTNGSVRLTAAIGVVKHEDSFGFRVFPAVQSPAAQEAMRVEVLDPRGDTKAMLERFGYEVIDWDGGQPVSLLVIGRGAVSDGKVKMEDLEAVVRNGGRVLVMNQDPAWCSQWLGLRYARYLTRLAWPVDGGHPALAGLDATDLANWRGESTFVEPRPDYWANPDQYEWDAH
ncbi:MAG: glycoside hydrolase family 2 protein, partial [Thermoguttaceae bacterium]